MGICLCRPYRETGMEGLIALTPCGGLFASHPRSLLNIMQKMIVMENKTENKNWFRRHPVLTVLGILFILGLIGSVGNKDNNPTVEVVISQEPEKPTENVIKVTSEKLRLAYKTNEVSADTAYEGKLVEISGTVDTIGKDITDKAYITFETPEQYSFDKVQCMFKSTEESSMVSLKKGQAITVQGTVSGGALAGGVIVHNCKLTKS